MIVFWHKRDLRLIDNQALFEAHKKAKELKSQLYPIFVFENALFEKELGNMHKISLHQAVTALSKHYAKHGGKLFVYQGNFLEIIEKLHTLNPITHIFSHMEHGTLLTFDRDKKVKLFLFSQ